MAWMWLKSAKKKDLAHLEPLAPPQGTGQEDNAPAAEAPVSAATAAIFPIHISPCERCGACCAFFPVTFPLTDMEEAKNPAILQRFSLTSGALLRIMRGTELKPPRCIALQGEIGMRVRCSIYEQRPSSCRNFIRSWEEDTGNALCDRARCVFGLEPFSQY